MNNARLFQLFQEYGKGAGTDAEETVLSLPGAIGDGFRREICLGPGIKLYLEQYTLKERMTARVEPEHYPLGISLCMSGKLNWTPDTPGPAPTYETRPGKFDVSLAAVNTESGVIECLPNDPIVMISLLVEPGRAGIPGNEGRKWIDRLSRQPGNAASSFLYVKKSLSPAMDLAARQMLNCGLTGPAKQLYLTAKTFEILSLAMGSLPAGAPARKEADAVCAAIPNPLERKALQKAKEILDHSFASPPSLAQLARQTGLNQTKLKKGFKHLFNTTISAHLLHKRLEKGRELLRTGDVNVSEAAWQAGYANRAHFTRAFTRRFGYPPSALLGQRNRMIPR